MKRPASWLMYGSLGMVAGRMRWLDEPDGSRDSGEDGWPSAAKRAFAPANGDGGIAKAGALDGCGTIVGVDGIE